MDIDATPGSATANSYVTVLAAWAILQARLNTEPWVGPSDDPAALASYPDRRKAALVTATRLLDEQMVWRGQPATMTQALAWPRTGMVDSLGRTVASDSIPAVIQQATALYALALLRDTSDVPTSTDPHVKRKRLGETEIEFWQQGTTGRSPAAQMPVEVRQMLRPYGMITGGVMVALART